MGKAIEEDDWRWGRMVEDIRGLRVEVRSKVVLPEVLERVKEVEVKVAVAKGRSYGEV